MRVLVADPPAYTPPYDHALCAALARRRLAVTLVTAPFAHGEAPAPEGYVRDEAFHRHAPRGALRRPARALGHVPGMLALARRPADVFHFQWLPVQWLDPWLLPRGRPVVITAHDVLPREARPGQRAGQIRAYTRADAVVVHSRHGAGRLVSEVGVAPERVHVIPHPAFHHLAQLRPAPLPLPDTDRRVVLFFGLLRPYKGIDVLLDAWRLAAPAGAELWIVGAPRMDLSSLPPDPPGVRWLRRFVSDAEVAALFRRADLAVLPYREIDRSGVLATAQAFGTPLVLSAVGGFAETEGATLVAPGDATALAHALSALLANPPPRVPVSADGPLGWDAAAGAHVALYAALIGSRG